MEPGKQKVIERSPQAAEVQRPCRARREPDPDLGGAEPNQLRDERATTEAENYHRLKTKKWNFIKILIFEKFITQVFFIGRKCKHDKLGSSFCCQNLEF